MVWKKGKKPEQYLFTITEEFTNDWNTFKNEASENKQNISNLLRNTVSSKINNDKKKKALVLSPHTDDAELGCGGTIAKLIEEGWAVHVIYFSAVRTRFPQLVNEAENSARILGMSYEILDFNTRYFPRDRQDILQILHDHSRKENYNLVFTPTTTDIHQDHGVVTTEAKRIFRKCTLLGYELPWNNLDVSLNCFIPLEKRHIKKKISALECYNTQKKHPYFDKKFLESVVKMRGVQLSTPFAEGFETIKVRLDQLI
ncbi:MAG: PIG-L family deacetylase [Candidatus Thermoplasmatota archaeon]|nr:PIG-L family deacetylase [Candidatus Thermoplasmatota archaeon]MEC7350090.1 PIG-L family deacetylase [Candidatus Thermoplasmatota archaeon]MEC7976956.1 PIG-L family deacetylase [Candidatus Thermoplasmatota archaeon]MEC8073596.1 PIG-L family deacetylase [Candidatus Thermoplasmatota archaeon]MEC9138182.1 PIG-L family deacetylase [Candidatus Thermoplasmatota archaeon]